MVITGCGLAAYYGYELLAGPSTGRGPTACAAVVIGALSTYFAYRLHVPQAIFSIPAITFLLPGLSFFRGMYLLTVETDVILGYAEYDYGGFDCGGDGFGCCVG